MKIQRTTALLLAGLALALLFGAYTVFSTATAQPGKPGAALAPVQAAGGGGCGCGGFIDSGTAGASPSASGNATAAGANAQDIYIRALKTGVYDKQEITVKKGIPVRLHFTADPDAGCGRQVVLYGLDVRAVSKNGEENVVEFTPQDAGTYEYNCGMRMWRPGKLIVTP
jgi:heme/copper-type cytochrome/quinol oxidase subunit 2